MSDSMECLVIEEWGGDLHRAHRPVPDVGVNDVLVEVEAASVGRTVANVINGDLGADEAHLPRVPGHEFVGRVVETGLGVDGLTEGDRVASYTYLVCDRCDRCLQGAHPLCEDLAGYVSVDIDGGYAEFARLPAGNALRLPAGLDPVEATVVPDAVATPYHVANSRLDLEPGDDVLVLGAGGGVGIHLVQLAATLGWRATAADLGEEKARACLEHGAAHAIDTAAESLGEATRRLDLAYDAVVDFTGVAPLIEEAHDLLAPGGRLVNLTTFEGRSIEVSPRAQVIAESEVVGSRSFSKYELRQGAKLVASGAIEPVVTETTTFDGVQRLLDRIESNEHVGRGAVRVPS